ncbi:hypothetical protein A3Q56_04004 [Intoshia linei]|uniref:Uncharacterized protein n=1 Tax=Intoshia linei TaxID=1819745 RepID=A0A177B3Q1_9BILA|nr:hypothetical protein A3Q56_04004 [Intoshia linei]
MKCIYVTIYLKYYSDCYHRELPIPGFSNLLIILETYTKNRPTSITKELDTRNVDIDEADKE